LEPEYERLVGVGDRRFLAGPSPRPDDAAEAFDDARLEAGALAPVDFVARFGVRAAMTECDCSRRSAFGQVRDVLPDSHDTTERRSSSQMSQVDP